MNIEDLIKDIFSIGYLPQLSPPTSGFPNKWICTLYEYIRVRNGEYRKSTEVIDCRGDTPFDALSNAYRAICAIHSIRNAPFEKPIELEVK